MVNVDRSSARSSVPVHVTARYSFYWVAACAPFWFARHYHAPVPFPRHAVALFRSALLHRLVGFPIHLRHFGCYPPYEGVHVLPVFTVFVFRHTVPRHYITGPLHHPTPHTALFAHLHDTLTAWRGSLRKQPLQPTVTDSVPVYSGIPHYPRLQPRLRGPTVGWFALLRVRLLPHHWFTHVSPATGSTTY